MRFSDCLTQQQVLDLLNALKRRTRSQRKLERYVEMATARTMALLGIDWSVKNPAHEYGFSPEPDVAPAEEPIPLTCLEAVHHRGFDEGNLDEHEEPSFLRTDNHNPANYDWDKPAVVDLRVERDGFYTKTVQTGLVRETRKEPVRTRKALLGPPELVAIAVVDTQPDSRIGQHTTADSPPPTPLRDHHRPNDPLVGNAEWMIERAFAAVACLMDEPSTSNRSPIVLPATGDDDFPAVGCARLVRTGVTLLRPSADYALLVA